MVADANSGFDFLVQYAWDGELFNSIPVAARSSCVWSDFIALEEIDLSYRGSFAAKRVRHVSDNFAS